MKEKTRPTFIASHSTAFFSSIFFPPTLDSLTLFLPFVYTSTQTQFSLHSQAVSEGSSAVPFEESRSLLLETPPRTDLVPFNVHSPSLLPPSLPLPSQCSFSRDETALQSMSKASYVQISDQKNKQGIFKNTNLDGTEHQQFEFM